MKSRLTLRLVFGTALTAVAMAATSVSPNAPSGEQGKKYE